ncbi:MAG TPA: hypothetical protein VGN16_21165 [Acidobacteriaceae bacterium]
MAKTKTTKYVTQRPVRHDGKRYAKNAVIELDAEQAAALLAHNAIQKLGGEVGSLDEELDQVPEVDTMKKADLIEEGLAYHLELKATQTLDELRKAITDARAAAATQDGQ